MNDLQSLLLDLHQVSGLNISIFDIDEKCIASYPLTDSAFCGLIKSTKEGKLRCTKCDHQAFETVKRTGKLHIYQCSFHLYEAVVPIYTYGVHTGYLMMGQTLTDSEFERDLIRNEALTIINDVDALTEAISKINFHTRQQIMSFATIIDICGKYLTLTNRFEAKSKDLADEVRKYIHASYSSDITIDQLCDYFYCSRATLINKFKERYGITVHSYLLNYRLEKALLLLNHPDKAVLEIASECGFNDPNYFSKAFKKKYGCSPSAWRAKEMNMKTE